MSKADDDILEEARRRFERCSAWESTARSRFLEDVRFANGDPDNGWQWPVGIRGTRDRQERPSLTINKTRQHCLQIINDARQNKPSVSVRPMGDGADYRSAQIFESIIRHIEYVSNAQQAYDHATRFQVQAGIGYWRIVTDYADDESFDQEVYIRRIKDPLSVYIDPDIQNGDGSDARFAFVFDNVPRDEFEDDYPRLKDKIANTVGMDSNGWQTDEHVRIAEYYRRTETTDQLLQVGNGQTVFKSELPAELVAMIPEGTKSREIIRHKIEWFKIAGDRIIDRSIWPGRFIPIVRVLGEETVIEGQLDRKGHVRALKDPQRIYNYWSSSAVEQVALQGKSPYVAPVQAIEGHENYWRTANTENHAVLPFNHMDDQGKPLPPPTRQAPPAMAEAYIRGMANAQNEMMLVSGQYQADFGAPSNERSGKAINERQRQGDNATYHYIDHLGIAIRYTGKILIDLIPKVYDTPRIMRILSDTDEETEVMVDPEAQQAYQQRTSQVTGEVQHIFNPSVGRYEVEADIGPAYATRRQEAFNAFTQIISQSPEMMRVAGDLMFKAADFPMADELAERLKRLVPPQAMGQGPPPELQQAQQQIQQLSQALTQAQQQLAGEQMKNKAHLDRREVDVYDAETRRMAAVGNIDPEALRPVVRELVSQALGTPIMPIMAQHAAAQQAMQPPPPPENGAVSQDQMVQ